MSETIVAAIVTGTFSLIAAVLTFLLTQDKGFFWQKKRVIRFQGDAIVLNRYSKDGNCEVHEQTKNPAYVQDLKNGEILITRRVAKLNATILIKDDTGRTVTGNLTANGYAYDGKLFLLYEVKDPGIHQRWSGAMIVYIAGIGDISAHFITESVRKSGHTNFGRMLLNRR